ncbi:MAG: rhamnulose-1-phosphate aldolase [Treponema sp.]|nr:rhamnulose-1-phosphate aldolase [Treponema sp.]
MSMISIEAIQSFIRFCDDTNRMGWHERNGGNLSYRMSKNESEQCRPFFYREPGAWTACEVEVKNLAGCFILVTGSGKYFKNVMEKPEENICIAEIDDKGTSYRIVWGLSKGGTPTSEFPCHLLNHSVKKEVTGQDQGVVYHAHPVNTIALTFVLPLTPRDFSRALWKCMTECTIIFPSGVGVLPWMVPGGPEIALASAEQMKDYDAIIWAHHGIFGSGPDFDSVFGLLHIIEKSAEIYLKASALGIKQSISDEELRDIAKAYKLSINEQFLE